MVYTFRELQDAVLRKIDEYDSDATREVVKDLLNHNHSVRLSEHNWAFMRRKAQFSLVPGQKQYPLHPEFGRPIYFRNVTTKKLLIEVPDENVPASDILNTSAVEAQHFRYTENWQVQAQPTSPSPITIVSSSVLDHGSNFAVVVKGEDIHGNIIVDLITPNGQTPATSFLSFARVTAITKAQSWNGTLTATANNGAVTLVTLSPWEMGKQFRTITLYETPASADTIEYEFYGQPLLMINDYDQPQIPGAHALILVYETLLDLADSVPDISPTAMQRWEDQRQRIERALYSTYLEGDTLGHQVRTVRYIEHV